MKAALGTLVVLAFIVFVVPADGSWQWGFVLITGVVIAVWMVEDRARR